jgi:two-component system chemotaxis response regulator CheY
MPKVDGVKVLKYIRELETQSGMMPEKRSKIIMTTALAETKYVQNAFDIGCDSYAAKPIDTNKFIEVLHNLKLIQE